MSARGVAASWCLSFAAACSAPEEARFTPVLGSAVNVVPSSGLPPEVVPLDANNNLDVIRHDGRVYFAFRTGPSHFAHKDVVMYVVSSTDQTTWKLETKIALGTDLREPRFLSIGGKLHFYFAVLGDNPLDFEPGQAKRITRDADGSWSVPADFFRPGFIPWRTKTIGGTAYMSGYTGGGNIYDETREPLEIYMMTTGDGITWRPAFGGDGIVLRGGGSETDFAFLEDGALVAVVRNEAGDDLGWGSKICRAEAGALDKWTCKPDPRKYDSPFVFRHGSEVYLIGRKNLANSGLYDLGRTDLDPMETTRFYQLEYSGQPKRCALWRVDPVELKVEFLLDLPSKGDTCFASAMAEGEDRYTVYNYTSPVEGPEVTWLEGQLANTLIYRVDLRFESTAAD